MMSVLCYQCPRCGGVTVNVDTPPFCWICGQRLEFDHACTSKESKEEAAAAAAAAAEPMIEGVNFICLYCAAHVWIPARQLPPQCPSCAGKWDQAVAGNLWEAPSGAIKDLENGNHSQGG